MVSRSNNGVFYNLSVQVYATFVALGLRILATQGDHAQFSWPISLPQVFLLLDPRILLCTDLFDLFLSDSLQLLLSSHLKVVIVASRKDFCSTHKLQSALRFSGNVVKQVGSAFFTYHL
jgi:hypothetical protein